MTLRTWLCSVLLISAVACGDDDSGPGTSGSQAVANALTEKLRFRGGVLRRGSIPETDADTVRLTQDRDVVRIRPGGHVLMSLGVDNPDEEDDPNVATLLQFEGADDHVEIEAGDAGTGDLQIEFDVEDDVCAELCNTSFAVRMFQAVKLRSGKISRMLNRTIELDCSDDGDEARCEDEGGRDAGGGRGDAGGEGGSGGGGRGGSGGSGSGQTTVATEFASAVASVNAQACSTCAGMQTTTCMEAPYAPAMIGCIRDAISEDTALNATAMCAQGNLASASAACSECTSSCFEAVVAMAAAECEGSEAFTAALDTCGFASAADAR